MRAQVEALVEELQRLRESGVTAVYVSEEALTGLRQAVSLRVSTPSSADLSTPSLAEQVSPVPEETPRMEAPRMLPSKAEEPLPPPPVVELPPGDKQTQWDWLRQRVLNCPTCRQHVKPGKQVVFGVGNLEAEIFFCGEAPGADEEEQGEPFVGKAGQLLTRIIQAMGLSREQVYIGNIMNWRPEMPTAIGNRPPTAAEMAYCLPYLRAQVAIVRPKVIVALGKTAVDGLLGPDPQRRMGAIRGLWQDFQGTPLIPTYHPSYLLRNNSLSAKRQVWEDMLQVMERLQMPISDKQRGFFLKAG